jgi:hypothetical protein
MLVLGSAGSRLRATITFDFQVDLIQTTLVGTPVPANGLVLLVADTSHNGFGAFGVTSLGGGNGAGDATSLALFTSAGSDDLIVWRGDLSVQGPGVLTDTPSFTLGTYAGATWNAGDPLALVWFPTLTLNSVATTPGVAYGLFSSATPLSGSAWVTPADGSSIYALIEITMNGATLGPGPSPNSELVASQSVSAIPEPSSVAMLAGVGALVVASIRRRGQRRA